MVARWRPHYVFLLRHFPSYRLKLYSVSRDGTDLRPVIGLDADYARLGGRRVSWSPHHDGPQIMFSPSDPLYLVHVDGAEHQVLRSDLHVAWSPDGSKIAVVVPDTPGAQGVVLYTVAPDGSSVNALVRRQGDGGLEVIDPDQRQFADVTSCSAGVVVPDPALNPGLVRDCQALLEMVNRTSITGLNWDSDTSIAEWEGVSLDASALGKGASESDEQLSPLRIRGLSLQDRGLLGSLPLSVTNLTGLWSLSLSDNELTGPIPPELGRLADLRVLILNEDGISGPIPPELALLARLRELSITGELTGPIPPQLGDLNNLVELNIVSNPLSSNRLSGNIPRELGGLSALKHLNLSRNELSGSIPPELGNLTELETLELAGNELSGSIPPELGNLTELETLELAGNELSGSIPPEPKSTT